MHPNTIPRARTQGHCNARRIWPQALPNATLSIRPDAGAQVTIWTSGTLINRDLPDAIPLHGPGPGPDQIWV